MLECFNKAKQPLITKQEKHHQNQIKRTITCPSFK